MCRLNAPWVEYGRELLEFWGAIVGGLGNVAISLIVGVVGGVFSWVDAVQYNFEGNHCQQDDPLSRNSKLTVL